VTSVTTVAKTNYSLLVTESTIGGGSLDRGDTTSTSYQKPPPETIEIHAQSQKVEAVEMVEELAIII
jgi:hypothetical protein